jgi:peptide/nickel transport system permease protein
MPRLLRSPRILTGLCLSAAFAILAIAGPFLAPYSPDAHASATLGVAQPPSAAHLPGTTQTHQDVLSQLLAGGRSTVLVSLVAGLVATALAVGFGVAAGYLGGWADDHLSMVANIFLVLPALPLLIVIFGLLGKSASPNDALIGFIIAVTGWAFGARQLRAETPSMRARDYIDSARVIGERSWRIMALEILPNLVPVVATSFLFTVIYGVGTYTAPGSLGVINTSHWSWGTMLYWAQNAQAAQDVHLQWWCSMLDVSTRLGVLNLPADLRARDGLAILYVTHDIASARYLADMIAVMYAGQVAESGPAAPLADEPAHPYTQLLLSAAPDPDRPAPPSLAGRGAPPNLTRPPSGCRFHPRCPHAMAVCAQAAPPAFALSGGRSSACWLHASDLTAARSRPLHHGAAERPEGPPGGQRRDRQGAAGGAGRDRLRAAGHILQRAAAAGAEHPARPRPPR